MDIPWALADDLAALTETLGDPVLDLQAVLSVLADDLTAAVPSYLGLSMTLHVDDNPITLTSFQTRPTRGAQASLRLPLTSPATSGEVTFYAGTPDAFADLADDARSFLTLNGEAVVDGVLSSGSTSGRDGISGLADFSDINQAIGVLIGKGHTQAQAHTELRRRASSHQQTLPETARDVLNDIAPSPKPALEEGPGHLTDSCCACRAAISAPAQVSK